MGVQKYKYDVAFSFAQQDEALAVQVNNLLRGRMSTFLYTEQQKEIAGKDGEEVFNKVFGSEARIVVVFYRKEWGRTSWTRIEKTAIKNRGYDKGYDFVLFIPLECPPSVPEWLPKTRLWVGLERWGIDGAASVIEARVQEAGGSPKAETVEEHAARVKREIENDKARKRFLGSEDGVKAASEEVESVFSEVEKLCESVKAETSIDFKRHKKVRELYIFSTGLTIGYCWYLEYTNTLDGSELWISVWRGKVGFPGIIHFKETPKLDKFEYRFDVVGMEQYGWRESGGKEQFFSSKRLAESSFKMFLEKIRDEEVEKQR